METPLRRASRPPLIRSQRRTTRRRSSRGRSRPAGWWSTRPRMTTTPLSCCTRTPWERLQLFRGDAALLKEMVLCQLC